MGIENSLTLVGTSDVSDTYLNGTVANTIDDNTTTFWGRQGYYQIQLGYGSMYVTATFSLDVGTISLSGVTVIFKVSGHEGNIKVEAYDGSAWTIVGTNNYVTAALGTSRTVTYNSNLTNLTKIRVTLFGGSQQVSVSMQGIDVELNEITIDGTIVSAAPSGIFIQTFSGEIELAADPELSGSLRFYDGSSIQSLSLVETSDQKASPIKVNTSGGIKSIAKL